MTHKLFSSVIVAAGMSFANTREPVDSVNPEIGNISHMLVPTFTTVHLPNAFYRFQPAQWSHVDDRVGPMGLFLPTHRAATLFRVNPYRGDAGGEFKGWRDTWDLQHAKPYTYSVRFDGDRVSFRLAPAEHGAIAEWTFDGAENRSLVFSPREKEGWFSASDGSLDGVDLYCGDFPVYFHGEFEQSPVAVRMEKGKVAVTFRASKVVLRFGVSLISGDQARQNAAAELSGKSLEGLAVAARLSWNERLSAIEVEGGTEDERTVFYTALYRVFERMCNYTEEGRYRGHDRKIHKTGGIDYYNDDWTWDTYRAAHPLMCILRPRDEAAKLTSYLRMAHQSKEGWLSNFPDIRSDTHRMNGMHTPALFLDAMNKGIVGVDYADAFRIAAHTERTQTHLPWYRGPRFSLDEFMDRHGYFPALHPRSDGRWQEDPEWPEAARHNERRQSVAVTLAYSFDSWCIARLAEKFGTTSDVDEFDRKARNCWNLWKEDTGFFHPKDDKGEWILPFDYIYCGGQGARDYYDENNAWTYIWDVQHALPELIERLGGLVGASRKLDALFNESYHRPRWEFYNVLPDSTGNMGQFTMGNEPSFHIPYIYNLCGEPWKTQKLVRKILKCWFRNDLMGVCGDEDGGGMSAFAVFSMMGFYPMTPGVPEYQWGSPVFTRVTIHQGEGRDFVLEARNASEDNKYFDPPAPLKHADIVAGRRIVLDMRSTSRP